MKNSKKTEEKGELYVKKDVMLFVWLCFCFVCIPFAFLLLYSHVWAPTYPIAGDPAVKLARLLSLICRQSGSGPVWSPIIHPNRFVNSSIAPLNNPFVIELCWARLQTQRNVNKLFFRHSRENYVYVLFCPFADHLLTINFAIAHLVWGLSDDPFPISRKTNIRVSFYIVMWFSIPRWEAMYNTSCNMKVTEAGGWEFWRLCKMFCKFVQGSLE